MTPLLLLPLDHLIANVVGMVICVIVIVSCICRLDVAPSMPWRVTGAQLLLIAVAFWAGGTLRELWRGEDIGFHNAAAGLAFVIYLTISYEDMRRMEREQDERRRAAALRRQAALHWEDEEDRHAPT